MKNLNKITKYFITLFWLGLCCTTLKGEVVKEAKDRKTGARALRSILENAMLDIMYEVPSLENIDTCIITDEVIRKKGKPIYKLLRKSA